MCDKAVNEDPWLLNYIPDWFVTQEQVKIWHDDSEYNGDDDDNDDDDDDDDDEIIVWYEGYKKRKAQKAQIEKELMPIVCHPSRW